MRACTRASMFAYMNMYVRECVRAFAGVCA